MISGKQQAKNRVKFYNDTYRRNYEEFLKEQADQAEAYNRSKSATSSVMNEMFEYNRNKKAEAKAKRDFTAKLKASLLSECIMHLYNNSFNQIYSEDSKFENLKKSLVNNLIEDYGTDRLLRRFRHQTEYLAEVAYLVDTTYDAMLEGCTKDGDCYTICPVQKDTFFDKLNLSNVEKIAEKIRSRVEDSVEEFITTNTSDKEKIKEVLQSTNDKVNNSSSEETKQESARLGKRMIKAIERKPKSIFNSMVYNMAETTMKDPEILAMYKTESGKLDMDTIMESTKITYTFLEMLNTTKMVEESYLMDMIKEVLS